MAEQKHRLIEGFCDVLEQWSAATGISAGAMIKFCVLPRLGWGWGNRRDLDEKLGIPGSKGDRELTTGDLRVYLARITERLLIWEDFLILGLSASMERELAKAVDQHTKAGVDENIRRARELEHLALHPDEDRALFEGYRSTLQKLDRPSKDANVRDEIMLIAAVLRQVADYKDRPGTLISYKDALAAWKELIAPVLAAENLAVWERDFFEYLDKQPGARATLEAALMEHAKEYE